MNLETFKNYKALFENRLNKIKLLNIGEDSIRYDFFVALFQTNSLEPSDIQLEYSMHESAYLKRNNERSKRKENPQIDLVIHLPEIKLNVEFGLFRQNSNEDGNINKTEKIVKMLNDMIRLGLDSIFTKRDSYFICIADDKILGHQLRSKVIGKFPSNYHINSELIEKIKEKKTSNFDSRFVSVLQESKISINASLVYNEELKSDLVNRETRIIIWKVTSDKL